MLEEAGGSSWRPCPDWASKQGAASSTRPPCRGTEARGSPRASPQCSLLLCPLWGPSPGPALGGRSTRIGGLSCSSALETTAVVSGTQASPPPPGHHPTETEPLSPTPAAPLAAGGSGRAGPLGEQMTLGLPGGGRQRGASERGWGSMWGARGCSRSLWQRQRPQAGTQG